MRPNKSDFESLEVLDSAYAAIEALEVEKRAIDNKIDKIFNEIHTYIHQTHHAATGEFTWNKEVK